MRANPCPRPHCTGSLWPDWNGQLVCSLCARSPEIVQVLPLVRKEWVWSSRKRDGSAYDGAIDKPRRGRPLKSEREPRKNWVLENGMWRQEEALVLTSGR
jgi:hypothetical protein